MFSVLLYFPFSGPLAEREQVFVGAVFFCLFLAVPIGIFVSWLLQHLRNSLHIVPWVLHSLDGLHSLHH